MFLNWQKLAYSFTSYSDVNISLLSLIPPLLRTVSIFLSLSLLRTSFILLSSSLYFQLYLCFDLYHPQCQVILLPRCASLVCASVHSLIPCLCLHSPIHCLCVCLLCHPVDVVLFIPFTDIDLAKYSPAVHLLSPRKLLFEVRFMLAALRCNVECQSSVMFSLFTFTSQPRAGLRTSHITKVILRCLRQ